MDSSVCPAASKGNNQIYFLLPVDRVVVTVYVHHDSTMSHVCTLHLRKKITWHAWWNKEPIERVFKGEAICNLEDDWIDLLSIAFIQSGLVRFFSLAV